MRHTVHVIPRRAAHFVGERCQFPYQGRHIFLECEGVILIHKKLFRLYRKEGLSVHQCRDQKQEMGTYSPTLVPDGPNWRWTTDVASAC